MSTNPYLQFVEEPETTPTPEADTPGAQSGNPYLQFVDEEAAPVPEQAPVAPDPTYLETAAANRQERDTSLADTIASLSGLQAREQAMLGDDVTGATRPLYDPEDNVLQNLLGSAEGLAQIGGNYVARAADAVGQAFGAAASATPEPVKEFLAESATAIGNTETGKMLLQAMADGADNLSELEAKYPQEYKSLVAGLELGTVGLPGSSKRATGAVIEEAAELTGDAAKRSRLKRVKKLLTPDDKFKEGQVDETFFGTTTWDPSPRQLANIEEVANVPTVNPNRTPTFNRARVLDNVRETAQTLDNKIVAAGNPRIDKEALMNGLDEMVENLDTLEEALTLSGDATPTANKILRRAVELIDDSDGTTLGILQARRDLDKWIETHGGAAYNPDQTNAKNIAQRLLRNRINDTVNAAVPDVKVKEMLGKQHRLLSAADDLELKAKTMAEKAIPRVFGALSEAGHVGPVGMMAIGGAAGTAVGGSIMPAVAGAGAGFGAWKLFQRMNPQQKRIWLKDSIKNLGKAMREGDPAVVDQLKADRLLLIDMLQELPKSNEEEPENG